MSDINTSVIFPKGNKMPELYSKYFAGQAYLQMLVPPDDVHNCPIGNVTFEPGCRNHWHKHPGGQILLVTGGQGWYQENGQAARKLTPGDVVKIPANAKHWHGATKDSWFVHLSVETNCQAGPAQWLEPVADDAYAQLK